MRCPFNPLTGEHLSRRAVAVLETGNASIDALIFKVGGVPTFDLQCVLNMSDSTSQRSSFYERRRDGSSGRCVKHAMRISLSTVKPIHIELFQRPQ